MPLPITPTNTNRAGLCPHGLPPAACPICSGGGMGGGGRAKEAAPVSKPISTEWSFMKCYAVGVAMRAQEARAENAKTVFEKQIEFAQQLSKNIENISEKIKNAIQNIKDVSPKIIQNIIQVISNVIINPVLSLVSQIPKLIEKMAEFQQKFAHLLLQASEKLTAILGDVKNFIERKIIDKLRKTIRKLFFFFVSNTEDENYKNDEAMQIFKSREIKKYVVKFIKEVKNWNKDDNRRNKE